MRWDLILVKHLILLHTVFFYNILKICLLLYIVKWLISAIQYIWKKQHPTLGWEKIVIWCGNERTPSHRRVLHRTL